MVGLAVAALAAVGLAGVVARCTVGGPEPEPLRGEPVNRRAGPAGRAVTSGPAEAGRWTAGRDTRWWSAGPITGGGEAGRASGVVGVPVRPVPE
ncbi:hypothetical protein GA0070617_0168 [Micromonospora yangpuensis]|uniref:Uncharacterized protein n=1 Tax=Micromonospora yangpuensis TaxID=683228 RepID=A0A1C6TWU7_9ACTN|nr:hypothetical protein GA0070617_0168 [Micromonospora yangpuensis]